MAFTALAVLQTECTHPFPALNPLGPPCAHIQRAAFSGRASERGFCNGLFQAFRTSHCGGALRVARAFPEAGTPSVPPSLPLGRACDRVSRA